MQPISDAARTLLVAPRIEVSAGLELLRSDLSLAEDITVDFVGGSVHRNCQATIHGRCELTMSRALTWGVDLVRPYMTVTDGVVSERWNVGVFALTTPERSIGELPQSYTVQGFDRLYLLDRQVGDDYTVAAGVTYRQALLDTFTAAGLTGVDIEGAAADDVLPVARSWPLVSQSPDPDQTDTPVTWLRVVNDLLRAINFRAVWADENGRYRCAAYREPTVRGSEFDFDAASTVTILGEERVVTEDVWATPNRWVAIASNPPSGVTPSEANGLIQVRENVSDGPTSQTARGLVWPSVLSYEAATSTALAGLIDRRVVQDRAITTRFDVSTGPFPPAGHFDIFTYSDPLPRRVQAVEWDMPLDGSDVQWVWEGI